MYARRLLLRGVQLKASGIAYLLLHFSGLVCFAELFPHALLYSRQVTHLHSLFLLQLLQPGDLPLGLGDA
jgi:hypothetical protein